MKKVLSFAVAGVLVAASAGAQNRVDHKTLRSFGDTINNFVGTVWSIGAVNPTNHPTCGAGRITIKGAAYAGAINAFNVAPREADDFIHDISSLAVFDASALAAAAPNGQYTLVLDNLQNLGLGGMMQVSVLDDAVARTVLSRGPFPANFQMVFDTTIAANGAAMATSRPVTFLPVTQDHRINLGGGGGGTLNVCLGPTGQVRMIHADNNADWATECHANSWRAETISLGAGSAFGAAVAAAQSNAPLTTYPFSCNPLFVVADTSVGTPIVVNTPIVVAVSMVDSAYENDRAEEFMWERLFLGGDNLYVLGGDPDFPTTNLWIEGN